MHQPGTGALQQQPVAVMLWLRDVLSRNLAASLSHLQAAAAVDAQVYAPVIVHKAADGALGIALQACPGHAFERVLRSARRMQA